MIRPLDPLAAPSMVLIAKEMARQCEDGLASFQANSERAEAIAVSIRQCGRLLMLGMGGSHAVGRAVEPLYRALGIDAIALPVSEQLSQPLPLAGRTVLLTSQSGESAEILRWIDEARDRPPTFGLTLEREATLARSVPSLVGAGETELAFAATRSLTITLSLHAAILQHLGMPISGFNAALRAPDAVDVRRAISTLMPVRTIITSGRRAQGICEIIALGLTELARIPGYALEGGQLRHGPMEMLGPDVGLIFMRAADDQHSLFDGAMEAVSQAGSPVVLIDASGGTAPSGLPTIRLTPSSGMEAHLRLLMAAQSIMTAFAAERVDNPGTPVRSSKVTRSEE